MPDFDQEQLLTDAAALPTLPGTVISWAGIDADFVRRWLYDQGWLFADGAPLPELEFLLLWFFLRDNYGSTRPGEFDLPDVRGRTLIGAGAGVDLTPRTLGEEIGQEGHRLRDIGIGAGKHPCRSGSCHHARAGNRDQIFTIMQPSLAVNSIIYFGASRMSYDDLLAWRARETEG